MVVELGLPDTKGWRYVKTNVNDSFRHGGLTQAIPEWKPTGNAWIEVGADAGEIQRRCLDGFSVVALVSMQDEATYKASLRKLAASGVLPLPDYGNAAEKIEDADEATDAATLADLLESKLGNEDSRREILWNEEVLAELFFRAAQHHRRGQAEAAKRIVEALFEHLPRKEALLEVAVRRLANQRQSLASLRFSATGDWKQYQADLDSALADFPRFWPERPLAERLGKLVSERVAKGPDPIAAGGQFTLTPEQVAWWTRATEGPTEGEGELDPRSAGQVWSMSRLPMTEEMKSSGYGNAERTKGTLFDLTLGWDWLSVMGAGLGDETLTAGNRSLDGMGGWTNYSSYRDPADEVEEPSEEELEDRWQNLARPKTRDEIARAFLEQAVPSGDGSEYGWWEGAETEEMREQVKAWREKTAEKTGEELVRIYLEEGTQTQRNFAATLLARSGTEEEVAKLEAQVLLAPREGMNLATELLRRRGKAGAAFLESYRTKLREEWEKERGGRFGDATKVQIEERFQSQYGRQLEAMANLVAGLGFPELLAAFVAGEKDINHLYNEIQTLGIRDWKQADVEAALDAVLNLSEPTAERRSGALSLAGFIARNVFSSGKTEGGQPGDEGTPKELPAWLLAAYGRLAEEGKEIEIDNPGSGNGTLSRLALQQVDALADGTDAQTARMAFLGLPEEDYWVHFEARGRARLEGKPVPSLPEAKAVPEARRAELKSAFDRIGTPEWAGFVLSLTVEERMVLRDLLDEGEPTPAWKGAAMTLAEVSLPKEAGEAAEKWKTLVGATLDAAAMARLLDFCQNATGGHDAYGFVRFLPLLGGIRLELIGFDEKGLAKRFGLDRAGGLDQLIAEAAGGDPNVGTTAVAFVNFLDSEGGAARTQLLDQNGKWSPYLGEQPPLGLYQLRLGESLEEAAFTTAFAKFIEALPPLPGSGESQQQISFGRIGLPSPETKSAENP